VEEKLDFPVVYALAADACVQRIGSRCPEKWTYAAGSARHVVMITKVYRSDGKVFVKFREDEVAGDDSQGKVKR
jgi:hypothetical protein